LCAGISQHAIPHSTAAADRYADAHTHTDRDAHTRAYVYPNAYRHTYQHA